MAPGSDDWWIRRRASMYKTAEPPESPLCFSVSHHAQSAISSPMPEKLLQLLPVTRGWRNEAGDT